MVSRESEPDDARGPKRPTPDGYPLLFKGRGSNGETGVLRRLLARILGFFRSSSPDAAVSDERRVEPPPRATGVRSAEPASPAAISMPPAREVVETGTRTHGGGPGEPDAPRKESPARDDQDRGDDHASGLEGETRESRRPLHRSTLQMLPGRLVPLDDDTLPREIRFMKPANPRQEVTLGREPGDPPDHVTLDHPSVPMRHATMRYRGGHWWIESLSDDPTVVLDGQPLERRGGPRHLKDGDIVRLGDLDFRFRMP